MIHFSLLVKDSYNIAFVVPIYLSHSFSIRFLPLLAYTSLSIHSLPALVSIKVEVVPVRDVKLGGFVLLIIAID